ncbi:P-loop containing nucleoside triphosphate hydrolase protein [Cercophora samala]|uniref:P-loop containing nucleoside triphosphate hydrolase protein n=1 Tax=Cercophora samala TaxID=330535 RepID=A0AA39YWW4_9PEZI|nr:P-loop containing nucleoside triphosphate hydrolase protein [Cercophora samala]
MDTTGMTRDPALVFEGWADHASRDRVSTDTTVHQLLKVAYPNHHITRTQTAHCDLLGFADAGHAIKTPDRSRGYDAIRKYVAPKLRHEKGNDKLEDEIRFGAWNYKWQNNHFIVFALSFRDYLLSRVLRFLYVVTPPPVDGAVDVEGHHSKTDELLLAAGKWTKEMHDEIWVFDNQQWNKDKELYRSVIGASWDDVILDPTIKSSLAQDVGSFFDNQSLYKTLRVPWKRGVILHGVPGNGKTVSIKAIINSLAARNPPVPAMYVKSLDGCSHPKIAMQAIFSKARIVAPCLLIFEDLDSLVEDKTRSYFLNEVDGLDSNEGILMIASTNHLDEIDPAITKRPSRFDRKYHFKVPEHALRVAYCRYWHAKVLDSPAIDFPVELCSVIADLTDGFSFAYIKELFISTLLALAGGTHNIETATGSSLKAADSTLDRKEEEKSSDKSKRLMPAVTIPSELEKNAFLQAILVEAKLLWDQMENEETDAVKRKKAAAVCAPAMPRFDFGYGDD